MTPARFNSSIRLLRGISIQAELNQIKLQESFATRDRLKSELESLAKLIGANQFADYKLLAAMSRRIGRTSTELENVKTDLALASKKQLRFDHAKTVLKKRIRAHDIEREEEDLMELTSASLSLKHFGQCATRKPS